MAIECERWQWRKLFASEHGPPDPSTRLVLFVLSLYGDNDGSNIFPSQTVIAARSGLSERSVRTHLGQAQKAGWVRTSQKARPGKKAWFVHEYAATVPDQLAQYLQAANSAGRSVERAANGAQRPANSAGRSVERAANGAQRPANSAGTPGNPFRHARQNLPPNSSSNSSMNTSSELAEKVFKKFGSKR